jgi:hypothetical protein
MELVWYWCEAWSLTLRGKHRFGLFEKRMLRIFGPKEEQVTGIW